MKQVFYHECDKEGVGLWRCRLPVKHCKDELADAGINLVLSDTLENPDQYDIFVFHRVVLPSFLPVIEQLKAKGKKIIYETDDNLFAVPPHNPSAKIYNTEEAQAALKKMIALSDHVIASTPYLATKIEHPDITVLPNLIDLDLWPSTRTPNDKIRIVWAGSTSHAKDHDEVVEPLNRLIEEYKDKIMIIFFGDIPDAMSQRVRVQYSYLDMAVPKAEYNQNVGLVKLVPVDQYPQVLATLQPDIGLAPLCDVEFNKSKSNIKWFDYSMCGAVTVATDCEPYHSITGITVPHSDKEGWYNAMKFLIDEPEERRKISEMSRQDVVNEWSWQYSQKRHEWINFFKEKIWHL